MTDLTWRVRSLEHPTIAVVVGVGFPWLVTAVLRALFPGLGLGGLLPLLYLAVALAESAVANNLRARNIGGVLPRLREAILVLAFSWLVLKIAAGEVRPNEWRIVSVHVFLGALLAMISWLLALLTHASLRHREDLLAHLGADTGGATTARGDAYRDLGTEATASLAGLRRVRSVLVALQLLGLILVFAVTIARTRELPATLLLVSLGHTVAGLVVFLALTGYIERQTLQGNGYTLDQGVRSRRTLFLAAAMLASLAVVIAVARAEPPLPARYLQDVLAWLEKILTPPERNSTAETQTAAPSLAPAPGPTPGPGADFDPGPGNPVLERIIRIVLIVLVAGIPGVALLVALVAPLFRSRLTRPHPLRALLAWWSRARGEVIRGLAGLGRKREGTPLRARLGTAVRGEARTRRSVLEEINRGRELRLFARVIRWGRQQGVPFHPSQGPREYTSLLAAQVPGVRGALDSLSQILEEQLYSGGGVARGRTLEYVAAARQVLRYRP